MSPFILIRDRRLVIDYSTYGNLSDQLSLCPSILSHLSLPNALNLNSFREEKNVEVAAAVLMSGSEWSLPLKCNPPRKSRCILRITFGVCAHILISISDE